MQSLIPLMLRVLQGIFNTNFIGKAQAALKELSKGKDFVYIHIEAPDECGHRHEIENKPKSYRIN